MHCLGCPSHFAIAFVLSLASLATCQAQPNNNALTDRKTERANLASLSKALWLYQDEHGHYPSRVSRSPGGDALLSWRVALLPYLGHSELHQKFRLYEPWNSKHNRKLIALMPSVFKVADIVPAAGGQNSLVGLTHAVVPVMDGTIWKIGDDQKRTIHDLPNGTAGTLAVFTAPDPSAVVWTKPEDRKLNRKSLHQDLFGDRQQCLFTRFDGSVSLLKRTQSNQILLRLLKTANEDAIPAHNAKPSVTKNTTDAILQKLLVDKPTLQSLSLENTTVTDTDLHLLKGLPSLKNIDLNAAQATDIGMIHIGKLITLETLDLSDTPVTDAGLAHLANLTNLKSLLLDGSRISNKGLRHLKRLTNLETLSLSGPAISDQGLIHLKDLTKLKTLRLSGTDVEDAGLETLSTLVNLEILGLTRTRITGPGLAHLRDMTKLKSLFLEATEIDDTSVVHLSALENLKYLDLHHTYISEEGVKQLQSALSEDFWVYSQPFEPDESSTYSFTAGRYNSFVICQGNWKLYAPLHKAESLFDLSQDRLERHDQSHDRPLKVIELLELLRRHLTNAPKQSDAEKAWLQHYEARIGAESADPVPNR